MSLWLIDSTSMSVLLSAVAKLSTSIKFSFS